MVAAPPPDNLPEVEEDQDRPPVGLVAVSLEYVVDTLRGRASVEPTAWGASHVHLYHLRKGVSVLVKWVRLLRLILMALMLNP